MLYIDDKPVPFDALTGEPLTNIQLVNGQWVLVPKIGKDVMPEYRVIPQALLSGAVLFEDAATKKKVGYIDANKLADYLENKQVPKGAGFEQFKKDIAKATGEIRREWNAYVEASNQRGLMPEITRRGQQVEQRLAGLSGTPIPDQRYVSINQDGSTKKSQIRPVVTTPESTLAQTGSQYQGYVAGRNTFDTNSPWSKISSLDFSTPGVVRDATGNSMLILTQTVGEGKVQAYAIPEASFQANIFDMPKAQIAQYQTALKNAGQWSGPTDGELNYLNRGQFVSALLLAAKGATAENLALYADNAAKPKGLFDVINEAAQAGGAGVTTRDVFITNREEAAAALDAVYVQSIGRKANKKEIDEFYRKVQKEAKARPTISTRTTGGDTTQAGFTERSMVEMASAQAEARPEFLAYQLSTNFYDALRGAAQLPVQFGEAPTTGPLGG